MKEPVASNIEWKKWGEKDPLMGVATRTGKDAAGGRPWRDEEFYALGESDWRDFFERWKRYGVQNTSCLEIGCGTGRITRELARAFQQTFALDVSEGMLEYAKRQVSETSVRFLLGDGVSIPLPDRSVTAVFSTHVFQHFDSLSHASHYFREIGRTLQPGCSLMIHLPIHHWPVMSDFFDGVYSVRKHVGDIRAWVRRRLIGAGVLHHHFMRGLSYSRQYLFDYLPTCGFKDVEILVFRTKKENVVHPFVFARRAE